MTVPSVEEVTVTFTCSKSSVDALSDLFVMLREAGNLGATRTVTVEDFGSVEWDGDGSHVISRVVFNYSALSPLREFSTGN